MSTTKPERSHPLIWVIGIVVFIAVMGAWGNYWFQQGKLTARAHDKQVSLPEEGPGEPDHAVLMADTSDDVLKLGKAVYNANCIACHGADGGVGALATARVFNEDAFAADGYGADPWGMYQTLRLGYNAMPAQGALSPEEKWAVVTYIREEFLKPNNEAMYIALTDEYLGNPAWPAAGSGGGAVGPHPATLPLEIPVQAIMAKMSEGQPNALALEEEFLGMIKGLSAQSAFAGDLKALKVITSNGQGPRAAKVLESIEKGDFESFEKMMLGRDTGRLNTWFVTRSQNQIREFFEALKGQMTQKA